MRIAIVTTSWPWSEGDPSGHFVRAEARELEREGNVVVVVAPPAGGAFGWPGAAARVRERPARLADAARWVAGARGRLRWVRVDRVVAHWALPCAWPVGSAAPDARLDVVSHGGDVRLIVAMPAIARRWTVRKIAERAASWRFVSEALEGTLVRALDRDTRACVERIAFVEAPRIEMPDVREAVARKRRELAGARVAVSVGRLVASKRVERAIERVARASEVDTLVVVGDGPERGRLEQLARTLGVDARFVGAVTRDEALAWIGAADELIHASIAEGMSTVVREAEALGTRVVEG
ncbi:MAG: glycosyltransferase family 4 protein [Polyangiaceae bacterium]